MPLYHLHLENSTSPAGDVDGQDMANDEAAIMQAGQAVSETIRDELAEGQPKPHAIVTIKRSDGSLVAVVRAYAAIERFG